MQNVRSRSNRIAALKQPQAGFLRRGHKPQRERLVTAHAPVESRRKLRRRNLIADLKCFRGLAVRIAALQRELVGFHQQRLVLELVLDPPDRRIHRAVVEPIAHAQREKVLAAVHGLGVKSQMFEGAPRQPFEFDRKQPEFIEGVVFQRIRGHLRFTQVALFEAVAVDDQDPVGLEVSNIHL